MASLDVNLLDVKETLMEYILSGSQDEYVHTLTNLPTGYHSFGNEIILQDSYVKLLSRCSSNKKKYKFHPITISSMTPMLYGYKKRLTCQDIFIHIHNLWNYSYQHFKPCYRMLKFLLRSNLIQFYEFIKKHSDITDLNVMLSGSFRREETFFLNVIQKPEYILKKNKEPIITVEANQLKIFIENRLETTKKFVERIDELLCHGNITDMDKLMQFVKNDILCTVDHGFFRCFSMRISTVPCIAIVKKNINGSVRLLPADKILFCMRSDYTTCIMCDSTREDLHYDNKYRQILTNLKVHYKNISERKKEMKK